MRPNLRRSARTVEKKHIPKSEVIKVFRGERGREDAKKWMRDYSGELNQDMVYILEQYVHGERCSYKKKSSVCDLCKIYSVERRTFELKWAYDYSRGWHTTDVTVPGEGRRHGTTFVRG